jgi:asparagine synthase (glutamine-hydrolysing)
MMSHVHFRDDERRKLWGPRAADVAPYEPGSICHPSDDVVGANRGFYYDLTTYLPGDILVKVDRAAMANGLEVRAPFLDRDVAEFALSLPVSMKVRENETKVALRTACQDLWPELLHGRSKQGFGAPINEWMGLPGVPEISKRVFAPGSQLNRLLPGIPLSQVEVRDYKTWMLLTLGLWLERHGGNE